MHPPLTFADGLVFLGFGGLNSPNMLSATASQGVVRVPKVESYQIVPLDLDHFYIGHFFMV